MSIAPSLFSLVFIAIGGGIFGYAVKIAGKAKQSLSWPSIEGEIAHSAILLQTQTAPTQGSEVTVKADISYRYKVNGRNYSSSQISLLDFSSSSSARARTIVSRYPDNSKVDVYYNPADPSEAVLEPGASTGLRILYLVGVTFAVVGLLLLVMSLTGHVHSRP